MGTEVSTKSRINDLARQLKGQTSLLETKDPRVVELYELLKEYGSGLVKSFTKGHVIFDNENLVNASVVKAFETLEVFKGHSEFTTYFYKICRSLCNQERYKKAKNISFTSYAGGDSWGFFEEKKVMAVARDPIDRQIAKEGLEQFNAVMDRLLPEHSQVLRMHYLDDIAYKDIARLLDINIGTVRSRIARAKANFATLCNGDVPVVNSLSR